MHIIKSTFMAAPAKVVFACVTQPELIPQWIEEVDWVRFVGKLDPEQPLGTRFRQRVREGLVMRTLEGEVVAYEHDQEFGVECGDNRLTMRLGYSISEKEGGCQMEYRIEIEKKSLFLRMVGGLIDLVSDQVANKHMASLNQFAQAQARK